MPTMSFLSDQMQKHLLSSTLQSNSTKSRHVHSGSPTNISTTPALSFVPTPSPSPFNMNADYSFTLSTDSKSMDMSLGSKCSQPLSSSRSNYDVFAETSSGQAQVKQSLRLSDQNCNILHQQQHQPVVPVQSSYEQISSDISFSQDPSPTQPSQSMSGPGDVKLVLVESATTSIPNSIALLTPQPISLIQQQPGSRQDYSDTVSSNSNINQVQFPTCSSTPTFIHPNKKKRLLTFLTEQENSLCSVNDNNQIILASAPQKSDQILFNSAKPVNDNNQIILTSAPQKSDQILFNSAKPVNDNNQIILTSAPQKSDQILFNSGKADQILINSGKTNSLNSSLTPTMFLQPCVNTISAPPALEPVKQEQGATLIINPPPPPKNESTLIINSDSTATLITPVVSATANLPLLAPCITPSILSQVTLSSAPPPAPPPPTNYTLVQPAPSVDILSVNFPTKPVAGHNILPLPEESNYEQYSEKVTCYKCKVCGYLAMSQNGLKHHLLDDHEDIVTEDDAVKEGAWLDIALKFGIQLNCPMCSNTFKSGRSFQVHVTEDHGVTENEAEAQLESRNKDRKEKAIRVLREEKQKEREARRRKRQLAYEAYIDNNNELKVRLPKSSSAANNPKKAITVAKSADASMYAKPEHDLMEFKSVKDTVMLPNQEIKISPEEEFQVKKENYVKEKSKPLKMRQYRHIAPAKQNQDKSQDSKCSVNNCPVRCSDQEKLRLHVQSHKGSLFVCPLSCDKVSSSWSGMKLHLWQSHRYDMDLYKCHHPNCEYRTISLVKLERHSVKHSEERPWLCPICGQAFKLAKQLRIHSSTVHSKICASSSNLNCQICKGNFSSQRQLRLHIDSVHHKKRSFLCSHCGYSASSKSSLKLHTRKHTGEKPFVCNECEYSTSDHNSFRRHKMQHSGLRPYNCPYCPYSSIQSTTYKAHLKSKHAVEDVSSILYQCSKCVFKTLKENIYLTHLAQHEN